MKNWGRKKIVDISTVFEDGDWIESKDQSAEGIRLIQTGNVGNGIFKDRGEKARYISENTFKKLRCTEIFEGDCLVSRLPDPVGRACILPDTGEKMITAVDCTIIRFDQKQLLSNWFLYYSLSNEYQNEIQKQVTGATRQRISRKNLGLVSVPIPPLPEQQRIVSILDDAFAAIAKAKANAEKNLKNAKELFESYLQGVFENGNWETKTIEMVCDEIFAGGDAPKNNFSLEPNEKHNIPIYANAVKDRGLYGYTDFARVTKPCVTIAARGSGTGHTELRTEYFLPIVRLIVCIPDTKQISTEFLKYTIDNLVIQRSGSAIPQLTVPMIKDYKIPVPSIEEQKLIIEKAETLKQQKENLESVYLKKIEGLEELKKSILQKAFAGELRTEKAELCREK